MLNSNNSKIISDTPQTIKYVLNAGLFIIKVQKVQKHKLVPDEGYQTDSMDTESE